SFRSSDTPPGYVRAAASLIQRFKMHSRHSRVNSGVHREGLRPTPKKGVLCDRQETWFDTGSARPPDRLIALAAMRDTRDVNVLRRVVHDHSPVSGNSDAARLRRLPVRQLNRPRRSGICLELLKRLVDFRSNL